jgi:RNA polymerase-binding protein
MRVGAGPRGDSDRGLSDERIQIDYFCSQRHRCTLSFAVQAAIPELWDCPRCGQPAGRDQDNPPPMTTSVAPYKAHLAYVRQRRSDAEAELLLDEALAKLRASDRD